MHRALSSFRSLRRHAVVPPAARGAAAVPHASPFATGRHYYAVPHPATCEPRAPCDLETHDTAAARLTIRFDGAARGNGKMSGSAQCGIGFAAWHRDLEVYAFSQRVANGTNNEAEYAAVKAAADWALDRVRASPQEYSSVRIEGDSELVIKQLRGSYKVKAANLKPFHSRTSAAIELLRCTIPVTLGHVYRERNSRADALAYEGSKQPIPGTGDALIFDIPEGIRMLRPRRKKGGGYGRKVMYSKKADSMMDMFI